MSKRVTQFSAWLFGASVVGALAFGLSVATARPASAMTCQDDGQTWVGSQPDAPTCNQVCINIHGSEAQGHWNSTTTCCMCEF